MNDISQNVKKILEDQNHTFNWLADKLEYSRQGLSNGLSKKTIKFSTLENIAKVLGVSLELILGASEKGDDVADDFITDPIVMMTVKRFDKISDKLSYIKDVYVLEICLMLNQQIIPSYPYDYPGKSKYIINDTRSFELIRLHSKGLSEIPYSKMDRFYTNMINSSGNFFEAFYFGVFNINFSNIINYLSDGFSADAELERYWKEWKRLNNGIRLIIK